MSCWDHLPKSEIIKSNKEIRTDGISALRWAAVAIIGVVLIIGYSSECLPSAKNGTMVSREGKSLREAVPS
jgi:hypothetical protein